MLVTVDTGGTKTLIASFNHQGEVVNSFKFATPPDQAEYIQQLRQSLVDNFDPEDVEILVIALPGIIKDGIALWCKNLGWKDFDVVAALGPVFGPDTPVLVENDANLAGLSEARLLDPVPVSSLYVTVSTGIGSGMVTNGQIDPGLQRSEVGRALVEYDGQVSEWESFASGQAIRNVYDKYARDIHDPSDWQDIADRISRGFLAIIPAIQPDVIIIGGSIGTYFDRYSDFLVQILVDKLPPHIPCPRFVQAVNPEEAVIYGAYQHGTDYLHAGSS